MKIDINKLSIGLHELEFEETGEELNLRNNEMFPNPIRTKIQLDKTETHIYLKARVGSTAHFSCDRCLKEFDREIDGEIKLYFEMVSHGGRSHLVDDGIDPEEEDIRVFRPGQKEIDLSSDIRDTVLLTVPMKLVCAEDCKGICSGCKKDLNEESCICSEKPIDPRWEGLQALLDSKD